VSQYTVGTGLSVTSGSSAEVGSLNGGNRVFTPSGNWQFQYDVTMIRNRHKIRAGAQFELLLLNSHATNSPAGAYFFDRLIPRVPIHCRVRLPAAAALEAFFWACRYPIASALILSLRLMPNITGSTCRMISASTRSSQRTLACGTSTPRLTRIRFGSLGYWNGQGN